MIGKKTLTLVLIVTIGLSLFVGLTYAASPGMDPISQILQLLFGISQSQPNSLRISKVIELFPGESRFMTLLPNVTGRTFAGDISLIDNLVGTNDVTIGVLVRAGRIEFPIAQADKNNPTLSIRFTGEKLDLFLLNNIANANSTVFLNALVQYVNSTNVNDLP